LSLSLKLSFHQRKLTEKSLCLMVVISILLQYIHLKGLNGTPLKCKTPTLMMKQMVISALHCPILMGHFRLFVCHDPWPLTSLANVDLSKSIRHFRHVRNPEQFLWFAVRRSVYSPTAVNKSCIYVLDLRYLEIAIRFLIIQPSWRNPLVIIGNH
jgi:hypothetical protein